MSIVIFEPKLSGHHLSYVVAVIAALKNKDLTLCVFDTEINKKVLSNFNNNSVKIILISPASGIESFGGSINDLKREVSYWITARRWYRIYCRENEPPSLIFVPYLDYFLHVLAFAGSPFGDTPVSGIAMRVSFHHTYIGVAEKGGIFQRFKELCFFRLLKNSSIKNIWSIDETLFHYKKIEKYLSHVTHKDGLRYLADPCNEPIVVEKSAARKALGISEEVGQVVLLYGSIDLRKGLISLLDAAATLQPTADSVLILVVGRQAQEATDVLSNPKQNKLKSDGLLIEINHFVDENVESLAFSASDIVWLGYTGHFSMSNVLVKAARYRKFIIGSNQGLIGWYCKRISGAESIDTKSPAAVIDALKSMKTKKHLNGDSSSPFAANNWREFEGNLSSLLERFK